MIMALDATRFHESKDFVKPAAKLYPVRIPRQHYQLRHFISTTEAGVVYHASKNDIYALYTASGKRERIASLDFPPVCFAAAYGWVCAGADDGRCVFIDVQDRGAEVDSLLPLNLDAAGRDDPHGDPALSAATPWSRAMRAKIHQRRIGSDILNSITLYRMKSEDRDITSDEDIAVISTNEKAIHIFSLPRLQPIKVLEFPVNMNHSSVSPDGNLLIACGDKEDVFFCRRVRLPGLIAAGEQTYAAYNWEWFGQTRLPSPVLRDTCFSTAFSPSGHVFSVASQNGIITVFETSRICEGMGYEDAVIDCFTSSRPAAVPDEMASWMPGAVRSSAFSPGPWDFFAWAEDRGRVCIADMRDGFRTRQMLELEPDASCLERCPVFNVEEAAVDLHDLDAEASFLHRHRAALGAGDPRAAVESGADLIERSAERRRRDTAGSWGSANVELTGAEREFLEAWAERYPERRGSSGGGGDEAEAGPFRFSLHAGGGQSGPSASYAPQMSVRQYIRERSSALSRDATAASTRALQPRRRSSVVISSSRGGAADAQPQAGSSASHPSSLLPLAMGPGGALSTSPSRLGASAQSSEQSSPVRDAGTDAWRTISAALTQASAADPPPSVTDASRRSRLRELSRHDRLLADEQQALERRRSRQRELGGLAAVPTPPPPPPEDAPLRRPPGSAMAAAVLAQVEGGGDDDNNGAEPQDDAAAQSAALTQRAAARDAARRAHLDSLLASNRLAQGRQDQLLERAERGLDAIRSGQLRRLQERAQLAEDRLSAGGRGSAAALGDLMREADALSGLGWARREREERSEYGVAVMGLGWSGDGRSLFVGTEEGIFEFQVQLGPRRCWPAINPR